MQIQTHTDSLKPALDRAIRFVDKGHDALRHFVFHAMPGAIYVDGSSEDARATSLVVGDIVERGRCAVPAAALHRIVKRIAPAPVLITARDGEVELAVGNLAVKLPGFDPDDVPTLPTGDGAPLTYLDGAEFVQALEAVLPVVSKDATRPNLRAVLLQPCGAVLRLWATDGVACVRHDMAALDLVSDRGARMLRRSDGEPPAVSGPGLLDLLRIAKKRPGQVGVAIVGEWAHFDVAGCLVTLRLVEDFPMGATGADVWPKPEAIACEVSLSRRELQSAASKVRAALPAEVLVLRLHESGRVTVWASEAGGAGARADVTVEGSGRVRPGGMQIGVDPERLLKVLDGFADDRVRLRFVDELSLIRVSGERVNDHEAVLMPMRIDAHGQSVDAPADVAAAAAKVSAGGAS